MCCVSLESGMNVRLTPELRARLSSVAARSGLKASDLIRMAVEQYCEKVEHAGSLTVNLASDSPTSTKRKPKTDPK